MNDNENGKFENEQQTDVTGTVDIETYKKIMHCTTEEAIYDRDEYRKAIESNGAKISDSDIYDALIKKESNRTRSFLDYL